MRTKLLFTFLIFNFLVESSFSQTYIPMLNNSTWNIVIANFGGSQNAIINPGIDVIIGSYTYKKFIDPTTSTDVFIREDINTKRVYRYINGADRILYDFSLQVSNSIILGNGYTYTVNSITNIDVNGGTRRKFTLTNGFFNETWIEGVGSNSHPLKPSYELPSDPYIYLTCSAQNGMNIYNHGIANGQTTPSNCSMLLGIEDQEYSNSKIIFSPNPFKSELLINSIIDLQNSTLKIYNPTGELVKEINNLNGKNIIVKRENLKNGFYFAKLLQNEKLITTHKIIISD